MFVQHLLDGAQLGPNIVGVEEFECFHRFEVFHVLSGDLCDFQQTQFVLILNEGATLNVSACFVCHFHYEVDWFAIGLFLAEQFIEDGQVDGGAQVIDIGEETVFATFGDELTEESGVLERFVEITVTGWVPAVAGG